MAMEVDVIADMPQQFDQAGVLVRAAEDRWVKAGIEFADGVPRLSAVVTDDLSDWSTAPVPAWHGRRVSIRVSWSGDALSLRARAAGEAFELMRLAPWRPAGGVTAGPYLCAPSRAGYVATFTGWRLGHADSALH